MKNFYSKMGVASLLFVTFLLCLQVQAQNPCVYSGGSCLDTRTFNCAGRIDDSLRCPGPGPVLCCYANARPSQCSNNGGYCTYRRFGCDGEFDFNQDCPRNGLVCCASYGSGGGGGGFGSSRRG